MPRLIARLGFAGVSLVFATTLHAQVSSSLQAVTLSASKGELVTLSAPTPGSQSITLTDGQATPFGSAITTTVAWDVTNSSSTSVKLVAYFDDPTQAFVNGSSYLTAGLVEISIDNGSTWHAVTDGAVGTVGTALGSFVLYTSPATTGSNKSGNHQVSFQIRINLTSNPTTSAGIYTATLKLMAICN